MPNVTIYNEGLCSGSSNSITKTSSLGIEYMSPSGTTGDTIAIGDIGTNGVLSDGSHLISGIYNGQGENELDPLSWDNIITN